MEQSVNPTGWLLKQAHQTHENLYRPPLGDSRQKWRALRLDLRIPSILSGTSKNPEKMWALLLHTTARLLPGRGGEESHLLDPLWVPYGKETETEYGQNIQGRRAHNCGLSANIGDTGSKHAFASHSFTCKESFP